MAKFIQPAPELKNAYLSDPLLATYMKRVFRGDAFREVEEHLTAFGARAAGEISKLGRHCELHPPKHIPFDPWGRRVDEIEVSTAWNDLHKISAQEGLIALGYERKQGSFSRLYQFAMLYLFHPSSAFYTCPLAMTDGAARILEMHGTKSLKERVFSRLTDRKPESFWTSGQWMTERIGGSDVSQTETYAEPDGDRYRLFGIKWFTSAVTSQVSLALASTKENPASLSLFCVNLRDDKGDLQNIQVLRLKDKLGTKAVPTAELELSGAPAELVGEKGKGVKTIASMLNITRLYNAMCSISQMTRLLVLAKDYAGKRKAFGKLLKDHPLHVETLSQMQLLCLGCFHLVFESVRLLGKDETGEATPSEAKMLRVLTPLTKLFTGKQAMVVSSELLEAFGGAGYIEDTALPTFLRDAQIFSIWEGTTNILSLDLQRALAKEEGWPLIEEDIQRRFAKQDSGFTAEKELVRSAVKRLGEHWKTFKQGADDVREGYARHFAMELAYTYTGVLLLDFAFGSDRPMDKAAASRWCHEFLQPRFSVEKDRFASSASILGQ